MRVVARAEVKVMTVEEGGRDQEIITHPEGEIIINLTEVEGVQVD